MKSKIKTQKLLIIILCLSSLSISKNQLNAQHVEVQGELKVTQMNVDDTQENLVIKNMDGTLGTRSVASLPPPPAPIDTTRNLASDFELAKHLCDCGPNIPPFLVESLLNSGYTEEDLMAAGVPFSVLPFTCGDTIIDDRDGKTYATELFGSQCWMTENLNVGTMITGAPDMSNNFVLEKYCYNDNLSNCIIYGGLYQWDEMMQYQPPSEVNKGVCPTNWHLPTDDEWKTLEMHLGMSQAEADMNFARGTDQGSQLAGNEPLWTNGNLDQNAAFGSSGFAALPGGYRFPGGSFDDQSLIARFGSSSELNSTAWSRYLYSNSPKVVRPAESKSYGISVRCVQD